jgi:hypothetical protein
MVEAPGWLDRISPFPERLERHGRACFRLDSDAVEPRHGWD